MVTTMSGEQRPLAAAPLDLRTRARGSSAADSTDPSGTRHSPAPAATPAVPAAATAAAAPAVPAAAAAAAPAVPAAAAAAAASASGTERLCLDRHVSLLKTSISAESRRADKAPLKLPFRKRKIPFVQETTGNEDISPRTTPGEGTEGAPTAPHWSPFTPYVPYYYLYPAPEPVGPVPPHTGHLCSPSALATWQDEDGDTPLHIAVVQGNTPVVRKLLHIFLMEHKSVDIYNNLRQTPLHLAVITQQANMVEVLLKAGADPVALDRNGQTALHLCCEYDQGEGLSLLLSLRLDSTCLETRNYEGLSPLHLAVLHGHKELARMLIDAGADINSMDNKSGQTPLMHAIESNNVNMVHFLIENGCEVNSQSYSRNTALHCACGRGQVETVRLLLKRGADTGLKNYHNDTPVMVTTNRKVTDVIRGKSSKQVRSQDQQYPSPSHRSTVSDSDPSSPSQSRVCSPSSLFMSHQRHPRSPNGIPFLSQQFSSPHSPVNVYHPVTMNFDA